MDRSRVGEDRGPVAVDECQFIGEQLRAGAQQRKRKCRLAGPAATRQDDRPAVHDDRRRVDTEDASVRHPVDDRHDDPIQRPEDHARLVAPGRSPGRDRHLRLTLPNRVGDAERRV